MRNILYILLILLLSVNWGCKKESTSKTSSSEKNTSGVNTSHMDSLEINLNQNYPKITKETIAIFKSTKNILAIEYRDFLNQVKIYCKYIPKHYDGHTNDECYLLIWVCNDVVVGAQFEQDIMVDFDISKNITTISPSVNGGFDMTISDCHDYKGQLIKIASLNPTLQKALDARYDLKYYGAFRRF